MVNLFGKSEKIISPTKNIKQWTDDLIQCLCSGPTNNQGYSYLPLYIDTVDNQVDLYIDGIGKEIKFGGGVRCVDGNLVSAVKISVSIISDLSHLNQDDVPKHSIGYFSIFDRNGLQNFPECGVILIGGRELETQIEDLIIKSGKLKKIFYRWIYGPTYRNSR